MTRAPPKSQEKNQKTLDKQQNVCYNKQCKGQAPKILKEVHIYGKEAH
jgi:hypothetical protein